MILRSDGRLCLDRFRFHLILADLDTPAGEVDHLGGGHLGHLDHLGGGQLRHPLRQEGFHLQRVKGQRVRWRRVKKSLKIKGCLSKDHLVQIWDIETRIDNLISQDLVRYDCGF